MKVQRFYVLVRVVLLLPGLVAGSGCATTYIGAPLQVLAGQSDAIAVGTVKSVAPRQGNSFLLEFAVDRVLSGTLVTTTPLRVLYHRILRGVELAEFKPGDQMIILLTRFHPRLSPYSNVLTYDYSIAGGDSEGAWFMQPVSPPENGHSVHIRSIHNTRSVPRGFKNNDDLLKWLSNTTDRSMML